MGDKMKAFGGFVLLDMSGFEKNEILRSEEHTSELQSRAELVCRLLREKKKSFNAATSTRAVSSNPNFVTRQKIEIIFG